MPKSTPQPDEPGESQTPAPAFMAQPAAAPDAFPMPLDEFCSMLSGEGPKVELIGGFHYSESAAGRSKDLPAAYRSRFDAYCKRPSP